MKRVAFLCVLMFSILVQYTRAAEIGFGIRDSQLQFEWLYGAAGDVRLSGGSQNPSRPLLSDGASLIGGETDEGDTFPVGHWNATADWMVTHGYLASGQRDDLDSISGSGMSQVFTFANNAYSEITVRANLLTLEFMVGGDPGSITPVRLRTILAENGGLADSTVRMDFFGPFGWQAVKVYESAAGTAWDEVVNLGPGLHRMQASAIARVVADPTPSFSSFQYTLSHAEDPYPDFLPPTIPEPTSISMLLIPGMMLVRRRRR